MKIAEQVSRKRDLQLSVQQADEKLILSCH